MLDIHTDADLDKGLDTLSLFQRFILEYGRFLLRALNPFSVDNQPLTMQFIRDSAIPIAVIR